MDGLSNRGKVCQRSCQKTEMLRIKPVTFYTKKGGATGNKGRDDLLFEAYRTLFHSTRACWSLRALFIPLWPMASLLRQDHSRVWQKTLRTLLDCQLSDLDCTYPPLDPEWEKKGRQWLLVKTLLFQSVPGFAGKSVMRLTCFYNAFAAHLNSVACPANNYS